MKYVTYTDPQGRNWRRRLPDYAGEFQAEVGVPDGPPSLEDLGLPEEIEIALHNQLFYRGIFTKREAVRQRSEIVNALMAALKLDAQRIVDLY